MFVNDRVSYDFYVFDSLGESYISTHAYDAENSDEVSFPAGVIVEVLQKNLEGWWRIM